MRDNYNVFVEMDVMYYDIYGKMRICRKKGIMVKSSKLCNITDSLYKLNVLLGILIATCCKFQIVDTNTGF